MVGMNRTIAHSAILRRNSLIFRYYQTNLAIELANNIYCKLLHFFFDKIKIQTR
jgi:hypothetical protein